MNEFSSRFLTGQCDLREGEDRGDDVGEDGLVVVEAEVREAEEEHVEDDAADVEGDERDQDLAEGRLQLHVPSAEHRDREEVACREDTK